MCWIVFSTQAWVMRGIYFFYHLKGILLISIHVWVMTRTQDASGMNCLYHFYYWFFGVVDSVYFTTDWFSWSTDIYLPRISDILRLQSSYSTIGRLLLAHLTVSGCRIDRFQKDSHQASSRIYPRSCSKFYHDDRWDRIPNFHLMVLVPVLEVFIICSS